MLDVKRMRVLREVAERGSFSAAAEALSFTQSAVSQQIAALERETGTQLVERYPRGIRLTEAGRALVSHTDGILARLDDAAEELAAIAGLRGGQLRFGSFPSAGSTLVPRAVAAFRERHPQVDLSMVEAEPENSLPLLRSGDLDMTLAFDYDNAPTDVDAEIERIHLLDDPTEIVLPRGHRLASRRRVKLEELRDENWIASCSGSCNRMHVRACQDAGYDPNVVFHTDDHSAAQAFVAAGVGVAVLPRLCLSSVHPDVEVRSIARGAPVRRVWAAVLADGYRSPACEAMLQILGDVSADFAAAEPLAAAS